MFKVLITFIFLATAATTAQAAAEDVKIGYVDMQKAIQSTEVGKKAKKELETEVASKTKEFEEKSKELKKMGEDFQKKSSVLSDEVKQKKAMELGQEEMKFRETYAKAQMDLQKKQANLTQPIVEKLHSIIDEIGQKEGYTVILEKAENGVLFAPKSIDLTDRVVGEFNKKK
jgi:outer membrane protein